MPVKKQEDLMKEGWDRRKSEPYVPASVAAAKTGIAPTAENRVAHALEYIAAQLGEINAKLSVIADGKKVDGGKF